jgi:hypothetical protein
LVTFDNAAPNARINRARRTADTRKFSMKAKLTRAPVE